MQAYGHAYTRATRRFAKRVLGFLCASVAVQDRPRTLPILARTGTFEGVQWRSTLGGLLAQTQAMEQPPSSLAATASRATEDWEIDYRPLPVLFLLSFSIWTGLLLLWTWNTWSKRRWQVRDQDSWETAGSFMAAPEGLRSAWMGACSWQQPLEASARVDRTGEPGCMSQSKQQ